MPAKWKTTCPSDSRFCLSGVAEDTEAAKAVLRATVDARAGLLQVPVPDDIGLTVQWVDSTARIFAG